MIVPQYDSNLFKKLILDNVLLILLCSKQTDGHPYTKRKQMFKYAVLELHYIKEYWA